MQDPGLQGRAETALDPEGCYIQGKRQDILGGENGVTQGIGWKELGIGSRGGQEEKYSFEAFLEQRRHVGNLGKSRWR